MSPAAGRSAVVAAERGSDQRVQRRGGLVAEAGEPQRGTTTRRGPHGAHLGTGAVVDRGVDVVGVGGQIGEPAVVHPDLGAGGGVAIGDRFCGDGTAHTVVGRAHHDSGIVAPLPPCARTPPPRMPRRLRTADAARRPVARRCGHRAATMSDGGGRESVGPDARARAPTFHRRSGADIHGGRQTTLVSV